MRYFPTQKVKLLPPLRLCQQFLSPPDDMPFDEKSPTRNKMLINNRLFHWRKWLLVFAVSLVVKNRLVSFTYQRKWIITFGNHIWKPANAKRRVLQTYMAYASLKCQNQDFETKHSKYWPKKASWLKPAHTESCMRKDEMSIFMVVWRCTQPLKDEVVLVKSIIVRLFSIPAWVQLHCQ